jgi:hypothetical protein
MSGFNGSGTFVRVHNWQQDFANSIVITDSRFDAEHDAFATGLSTCITKDGQTTITANLPMATYRHTDVGNASARTDYAAAGQIADSSLIYSGTVGGTVDVITLVLAPVITAYAAGQTFRFIAAGDNTTNVTINVDGVGAKAITKNGTTALVAGDIKSGHIITITYDGTQFQLRQGWDGVINANWTAAGTTCANLGTVTTADINGGTWQGTIDGAWTAAGQTCADLGVVTTVDINGGTWKGTIDGNWTAAGQTCADLGTVTTADINGGTWQGTIDGSWTAAGQTCADLGVVTTALLTNAGVGIARTEGTLHVHTATAGSVTAATTADDLVVENSGDGGISILTPAANTGHLSFGSPTSNQQGEVTYNHSSDTMFLRAGATSTCYVTANKLGIGASPSSYFDMDTSLDGLQMTVTISGSTTTTPIAEFESDIGGAGTTVCRIMTDGDLENTNNAYGAISDAKLKNIIGRPGSKLMEFLQVEFHKFSFKNNPEVELLGVVAQEIEQIWPGLVKTSPDYKEVLTREPLVARTELKQKTKKIKKPSFEIVKINGKYKKRKIEIEFDDPQFDIEPLFDEEDVLIGEYKLPIMEEIALPDEDPKEVPKKRVPVLDDEGKQTYTKSVKYSVLSLIHCLATQELYKEFDERLKALEGA